MDGVISDTQKLHAQIESKLLSLHGVHLLPHEISRRYAGVNTRKFFGELLHSQLTDDELDNLMERKWEEMAILAAESVDPIDGSVALIKRLHSEGYKIALASASPSGYVDNVITNLGLNKYFSFFASGDMVKHGKPDPGIFLLAAAKIGVHPNAALVIEDGMSGMIAARAAGMHCIGLVEDTEGVYPTKNLVHSLHEITSAYLNNLL